MPNHRLIAATAACLLSAACTRQAPPQTADSNAAPAPERAGQPVDPLKTAAYITAARLSAVTGDREASAVTSKPCPKTCAAP